MSSIRPPIRSSRGAGGQSGGDGSRNCIQEIFIINGGGERPSSCRSAGIPAGAGAFRHERVSGWRERWPGGRSGQHHSGPRLHRPAEGGSCRRDQRPPCTGSAAACPKVEGFFPFIDVFGQYVARTGRASACSRRLRREPFGRGGRPQGPPGSSRRMRGVAGVRAEVECDGYFYPVKDRDRWWLVDPAVGSSGPTAWIVSGTGPPARGRSRRWYAGCPPAIRRSRNVSGRATPVDDRYKGRPVGILISARPT